MTTVDLSNLRLEDLIDDNNNLNKSETSLNEVPLLKFKKTILVNSVRVDLICIEYTDKLFVSITTTGRFGTSVYVRGENLGNEQIYNIKTLFGAEEPCLEVFARSLTEKFKKHHSVNKSLLVNIGLEKKQLTNTDLLHTVEKAILDFYHK